MAEPQTPSSIKFPQGVNNRDREYEIPEGALKEAVNLDITRFGGLVARPGLRLVGATECHSLFAHPGGGFVLLGMGGKLFRLDRSETLTELTDLFGEVSYAVLNDEIYWTDSHTVGRVDAQGQLSFWGINSPPTPLAVPLSFGGLFAGTYQVAMSVIHPSGLESGVRETVFVDVTEGGGLQVTTPSASGVRFAIYRTGPNGASGELRQALVVEPGVTVALGVQSLGKLLETLHVERPLPGQCLISHRGRLWVASGRVLWFTDTQSPHWLRVDQGYYQFESDITMLAATQDGVFVGLYDRILYLQGSDPYQMNLLPVSLSGAASRSAFEIPYDLFLGEGSLPYRQSAWWDAEGFLCVGKPGGFVVRPTKAHFSAGTLLKGFGAYRAHEGLRQLVSVLDSREGALVASSIPVSEVFAHGVVLNP